MRNRPIKNKVLKKDTRFWPSSVSILIIKIDEFSHEFDWLDYEEDEEKKKGVTVADLETNFAQKIKDCTYAELTHETPLHDGTYEYNKDDGQWYLVKQGQGYA
jgi:hypothetical protein